MQESSPNPYASPEGAADIHSGPVTRLFSPGQVAWATFLGAPLAGSVLLAMNYRRLNKPTLAKKAWVGGTVATVLLMIVAFLLPDSFPSSVMPIACVFAMHQFAKMLQGSSVETHLLNGGAKASGWLATGIGVLSVIVILAVVFVVLLMLPLEWIE